MGFKTTVGYLDTHQGISTDDGVQCCYMKMQHLELQWCSTGIRFHSGNAILDNDIMLMSTPGYAMYNKMGLKK